MAATHSPCPGSGERQRRRGGKGYDGHTGMILIEDYGLLMLLDRDTRRSPRTRVLAVITRRSAHCSLIHTHKPGSPLLLCLARR